MAEMKSFTTPSGKKYDSFQDQQARDDVTALQKQMDSIGVVSVHDFGAVGDGVTDDSQAFINALKSGKKVVCDGTKAYYFTNPIDVRTLKEGHLDGNNARFENFHIYININDGFNGWRTAYSPNKFTIENMVFAGPNAWSALPTGWETPLITTGAPMILRNFVVKGYPCVVATTDNYIDFMHCEAWSFLTNPELFEGKTLPLDAVAALNTSGQYCKPSSSGTPDIAGDGWRFIGCNEFRMDNHEDYCLIRVLHKQPVLFESCIQSRVDILENGRVIANGCHYEQTYFTASVLDGNTSAVFINCFFYPTHKLLNHKNVTYLNCVFINYMYKDYGRTLADVTCGKSWYDLECHLINCSVGQNRFVDTDSLRLWKNSPKRTYRNTANNGVFSASMSVVDGWLSGFYPQTGTYTYNVFLMATSQPDIALKKKTYTAAISTVTKKAEFTISNAIGGYGIVIVRTNPDGTFHKTEYYLDPGNDTASGVSTKVTVDDNGAFCQFAVSGGATTHNIFTPWVTVSAMPSFTINDKLYEANGALVTLDDSDCGVKNGQIQVFKQGAQADETWKDELYIVGGRATTVNLNDEVYEPGSFANDGTNGDEGWQQMGVYRTKNYIPVEGGRTILCTFGDVPAKLLAAQPLWDRHGLRVWQYDASKTLIVGETWLYPEYKDGESSTNLNANRAITLDANTAYIRFRMYHDTNTSNIEEVAIEAAIMYAEDVVTSYIPHYTETKFPFIDAENVAVKSPSGTLYTLTVSDDGTLGVKELVYKP